MRLLLLFTSQRELRVSSVSDQIGVAKATAHRLLSTLARRGFVTQDRVTKVYRLGEAVIELGLRSVSDYDLREIAMPHVRALVAVLHETVNLIVLDEDGCRFIGGVQGDQPVRTGVPTGSLLPAHACSGGKLLLSHLEPENLRSRFPRGLRRITDNTHRRMSDLKSELGLIRMRGYAINDEESAIGLRAIAVPIRDRRGGVIAALAMSAPAYRLEEPTVVATVHHLRETAAHIRNALPPTGM